MDTAHGHFLYRHFLDDRRNACLGTHLADCRTARFLKDADDPRDTVLFGLIRQRLYPPGLDRIHRYDVVDRDSYFRLLDDYCYTLGLKGLKNEFMPSDVHGLCAGVINRTDKGVNIEGLKEEVA